jgi:hypothetical protein
VAPRRPDATPKDPPITPTIAADSAGLVGVVQLPQSPVRVRLRGASVGDATQTKCPGHGVIAHTQAGGEIIDGESRVLLAQPGAVHEQLAPHHNLTPAGKSYARSETTGSAQPSTNQQ